MCVITIISFLFILQTIAKKVVANAAEEAAEEEEEEEAEEAEEAEEVAISHQPVVQQHNLTRIRSTPFFHEFGIRCFHSDPMSQ